MFSLYLVCHIVWHSACGLRRKPHTGKVTALLVYFWVMSSMWREPTLPSVFLFSFIVSLPLLCVLAHFWPERLSPNESTSRFSDGHLQLAHLKNGGSSWINVFIIPFFLMYIFFIAKSRKSLIFSLIFEQLNPSVLFDLKKWVQTFICRELSGTLLLNNDLTTLSDAKRMWATCKAEHVSPYFVFMPVNGPQSAALAFF